MDNRHDSRYEELYSQLLDRGLDMHEKNKKRIRNGLILLLLLPFILGLMLRVTGSDRIVFLIIWVFCMFALSIYLISIEYIDDSVQKTIMEVTEREADFDDLFIGTEQLGERIRERRERILERIAGLHGGRSAKGDDLTSAESGPADTESGPADTESGLSDTESEDAE